MAIIDYRLRMSFHQFHAGQYFELLLCRKDHDLTVLVYSTDAHQSNGRAVEFASDSLSMLFSSFSIDTCDDSAVTP